MTYPAFNFRGSVLDYIFEFEKLDITCTYVSSYSLARDIDPCDPETTYHRTFVSQCLRLDTSFHSIETQCAIATRSLKNFAYYGKDSRRFVDYKFCLIFHKILMLLFKHIELSADGKTLLQLFCSISQVGLEILRTKMADKLYLEHHWNIICSLFNLQKAFLSDPFCQNSYIYYWFSIFHSHGYIGESSNKEIRTSQHLSGIKNRSSPMYAKMHQLGA